ncbi:hypothetical protein [Natranaerobius trueperi]|uniref:hypothetical protein n=1 Tax=Natranaerobius trueperi TaxID=759412 RepID=UPI00130392D5|nr:hypothetical protein [Natranaerobius trueperi]
MIFRVDIAKETHVARTPDFRGVEFSMLVTLKNTRKGFKKSLSWLEIIKKTQ